MSFQTPITIAEAIRNIENNRYLLPSIQREFEWSHSKIEWLFDSIMRNYPISSFLFWRVEDITKNQFKFYKFIREFRQRYKTHNEEFSTTGHSDFTAILDGQQRLTSLYIGLRGSYAYRTPRLREEDSERVYPTRFLYLNIVKPLENEEDGRQFEFKFLTNEEYEHDKESWFKVSEIYGLSDDFEFNKYLDAHNLKAHEFSYKTLATLKNIVHSKPIINFFLETEQNIDKALNIFIRINSGGEPLNFSDLIMSIAVANWDTIDARKEIHALTDAIVDKGFTITKDFVLKTFLFLHSKDIKFKVTNFSKANAQNFEKEWLNIRDSILSAFDLVKSFGFVDTTLTSKNAVLPIIYYLYHRNIYKGFDSKIEYAQDRDVIRKWIHTALVKRLFGAQTDSVLNQIRRGFTDDVLSSPIDPAQTSFPVADINQHIRKDLGISDEFISELLMTQKDEKYAFSILALLYPDMDYRNNNFHKDHLHPEIMYSNIPASSAHYDDWETYNSIKNLQMLDANENQSKNGSDLHSWITSRPGFSGNKEFFLNRYLIPDTDLDITNFSNFITLRENMLRNILKEKLA